VLGVTSGIAVPVYAQRGNFDQIKPLYFRDRCHRLRAGTHNGAPRFTEYHAPIIVSFTIGVGGAIMQKPV